jgi:hypothetical protein
MPIVTEHLQLGGSNPQGETLAVTSYYLLRNGKPFIPVMGEFHFSRYPHQYWEEELLKMKAGGISIVATYVFWIHIEEEEGVFDWSGNHDLRQFVALCGKCGLQSIVRIGPFAHGECRNGGLPDWLYGRPFNVRSEDGDYLRYVERLYRAIFEQLDGLLYKDGGPIIGVQLENEYMHAGAPWEVTFRQAMEWVPAGTQGVEHMKTLKRLAQQAGFDVPLYTCTGWLNSPVIEGELLPMQGGYAFTPWSPDPQYRQLPTKEFLFNNRHLNPVRNGEPTYDASRYPYACCEIGSGIQDTYYHRNIVPPQSVEAMAVVNLAGGANIIGYYMYHGGTHPTGKHSFMNEFTVPRKSYDFQAPLREFGQIADSYRYLRLLHLFLHDFGEMLAPMQVILPDNATALVPENTTNLRYAARAKNGAGFVFINNYQDHVEMRDLSGIRLTIHSDSGQVTLPYSKPLTVGQHVTAVLPFGLTLDGIGLKYATTQLLTKIERANEVDYVFFAPNKMVSEYAFDLTTYGNIRVNEGEVVEDDKTTYVVVRPGTDCVIHLDGLDGKVVRIITLTRQQAENCTKQRLWEGERLVISQGTLVNVGEDSYFYSTGQDEFRLLIYPPPEGQIASAYGTFTKSVDGIFICYTQSLPHHSMEIPVDMIGTDKAVVRFGPDLLSGVNNVYLSIDYVGDIGNAFIDGTLVSDHFYNGTKWEIGLKHFWEQLRDKELFILINPIKPDSSLTQYVPTGMAFTQDAAQTGVAFIRSITAYPEFKIGLEMQAQ